MSSRDLLCHQGLCWILLQPGPMWMSVPCAANEAMWMSVGHVATGSHVDDVEVHGLCCL